MHVLMPGRILERHVGGNTTYARELARNLRTMGVEVSSMPYASNPVATMALESASGRRRHADTVMHYTSDTGPLLRTRTPSVITVHGVASRWISTARSERQETVWRWRVKRALASTNGVITVSQSGANDVSKIFGVDPASITVIPHGIDTEVYRAPRELSDDLRSRTPDEFLLYLGNIEPRKNIVELIEAVNHNPDLPPLVVAGKPAWNYEQTMQAMEASSRTTYLGFVSDDDRAALMQRCALFVFPSLYEGFGFPVVEALSAGALVLTSDKGSLPEVSGPSAVVEDVSSAGLAAGISKALGDTEWQERCRAEGQAWSAQYSWTESARRHLDVYQAVSS